MSASTHHVAAARGGGAAPGCAGGAGRRVGMEPCAPGRGGSLMPATAPVRRGALDVEVHLVARPGRSRAARRSGPSATMVVEEVLGRLVRADASPAPPGRRSAGSRAAGRAAQALDEEGEGRDLRAAGGGRCACGRWLSPATNSRPRAREHDVLLRACRPDRAARPPSPTRIARPSSRRSRVGELEEVDAVAVVVHDLEQADDLARPSRGQRLEARAPPPARRRGARRAGGSAVITAWISSTSARKPGRGTRADAAAG